MSVPGYPTPGYPSTSPPAYATPAAPPSRPGVLTAAFFAGVASALFTLIGAVLLIVSAQDLAQETADKELAEVGLDSSAGGAIVQQAIDDAATTLSIRGYSGVFSAVLTLAFVLAARNGALWARIVATLFLVGSWCANGLVMFDVAPTATIALDGLAIVLSLVAVVLFFLPAVNRYAAARRR
ncbi:hypothetical protein Val02_11810 [Virgisporangium aliadipatigenens]|uniref:Uncharacterized protein n=1 Tax=Virgisporangium aliadipatigenens TaxID=741659 RepID=A0A8J3YHY2_9ACTN|nr:hypothetical protein [Virgisporangium aliadipatigenens]GIJ44295.1 hypothetical protein Val02_11810 [Virgisporangium aliadipatigenens]